LAGWIFLAFVGERVFSGNQHALFNRQTVGLFAFGGVVMAAVGFGSDTAEYSVRLAMRRNLAFAIAASALVFVVGAAVTAIVSGTEEAFRLEYLLSWITLSAVLFGMTLLGRWVWGRI